MAKRIATSLPTLLVASPRAMPRARLKKKSQDGKEESFARALVDVATPVADSSYVTRAVARPTRPTLSPSPTPRRLRLRTRCFYCNWIPRSPAPSFHTSLFIPPRRPLAGVASLFSSPTYSFRVLRSPLLSSSLIRFLPYPLLLFLLLSSPLLSLSSSLPLCFFLFFFFFFVKSSLEYCAFACFFSVSRLFLSLFLACLSRYTFLPSSPLGVFPSLTLSSWLRLYPGVWNTLLEHTFLLLRPRLAARFYITSFALLHAPHTASQPSPRLIKAMPPWSPNYKMAGATTWRP